MISPAKDKKANQNRYIHIKSKQLFFHIRIKIWFGPSEANSVDVDEKKSL